MIFNEPKVVAIAGTVQTHTFDSTDDVIAFAKNEAPLWSNFTDMAKSVPSPVRSVLTEQAAFYPNLQQTAEALDLASHNLSNQGQIGTLDNQLNLLLTRLSNGLIKTSESPSASEVLALLADNDEAAAFLYIILYPQAANYLGNIGNIGAHRLFRAAAIGGNADAIHLASKNAREAAQRLASEQEALIANTREQVRAIESDHANFNKYWGEKLGEWLKKSEDQSGEQLEEWSQRKARVEEDWERIKQMLDERVSLAAPTEYWGGRAKKLTKACIYFGAAFIMSIAVPIILFFIWGLPYIRAFPAVPDNKIMEHSSVLIYLLPLLIPSFVFIWILRIIGRLFSSYVSLSEDARERKTMVETYLALSKEGADGKPLLQPEDRQLILKALFRTGKGDSNDDSPPVSGMDALNRLMGGQHK